MTVLRCPECAADGAVASRIGNRRASCGTCNRFAQRVERELGRLLRTEVGPEHTRRLRAQAELTTYEGMVKAT